MSTAPSSARVTIEHSPDWKMTIQPREFALAPLISCGMLCVISGLVIVASLMVIFIPQSVIFLDRDRGPNPEKTADIVIACVLLLIGLGILWYSVFGYLWNSKVIETITLKENQLTIEHKALGRTHEKTITASKIQSVKATTNPENSPTACRVSEEDPSITDRQSPLVVLTLEKESVRFGLFLTQQDAEHAASELEKVVESLRERQSEEKPEVEKGTSEAAEKQEMNRTPEAGTARNTETQS